MQYIEMMKRLWISTNLNMETIKKNVMQSSNLTYLQVTALINTTYSPEEKRIRRRRISQNNEVLKGRVGSQNPNWKGGRYLTEGYWEIPRPDWFTGYPGTKYAPEHVVIYCETHNLTEVPKGFHIHHKDLNPLNNDPSNLEMLSKSEHGSLHAKLRGEIE